MSTPYVPNDPTVTGNDPNWFVWCLTPTQMVNVLSIFDVGAPIVFPDTYNEYNQLIMQLREFPNEIPEDSCMDLCQLIIQCIEDTPALQDIIAQQAIGAGCEGTSTVNEAIQNTSLIGDETGCDDDLLFGFATGLVDWLDGTATDTIEIWDNAVNAAARMGDMIEAIPIIGEAPFDDVLQFAETLLQDLADNYAAAYTAALRDEYRCDIWCLADQDCNITMHELFDYFNDRLTTPLVLTDVNSFIAIMLTQAASGTALVDAFNVFVLASITFGSSVLGIDIDRLVTVVTALFNDPDNDWDGLCASCGYHKDWLDGNGNPVTDGWVVSTGSYNAVSEEMDWANWSISSNGVVMRYTFTGAANVSRVKLTGRTFMVASDRPQRIKIFNDSDVLQESKIVTIDSTPNNQTFTVDLSGIDVDVLADWYITVEGFATIPTPTGAEGEVYFETLRIEGDGTSPF